MSLFLLFCIQVLFSAAFATTFVNLTATADSTTVASQPNQNIHGSSWIDIGDTQSSNEIDQIWMMFSFTSSQIPSNANITYAQLSLTSCYSVCACYSSYCGAPYNSIPIHIYATPIDWVETTITYANAPSTGLVDLVGSALYSAPNGNGGGVLQQWNLTNFAAFQPYVSGGNFSVRFNDVPYVNQYTSYASRITPTPPFLTVGFSVPPIPEPTPAPSPPTPQPTSAPTPIPQPTPNVAPQPIHNSAAVLGCSLVLVVFVAVLIAFV